MAGSRLSQTGRACRQWPGSREWYPASADSCRYVIVVFQNPAEDAGRLADISGGRAKRLACGARAYQPFIASLPPGRESTTLSRHMLRRFFRTACKVLGKEGTGYVDHPSRTAQVDQPRASRWLHAGRGAWCGRAFERVCHLALSESGGRLRCRWLCICLVFGSNRSADRRVFKP
jgi:hypothetical protein